MIVAIKKYTLGTLIMFAAMFLSFATATAQTDNEAKLKSLYESKNYDKCDALCAKIEKKNKDKDDVAVAHLYAALANFGLILDENFDAYDTKKPIKTAADQISRFYRLATDSMKVAHDSTAQSIVYRIENVIIDKMELQKISEAKYLAEKLLKFDSLNYGAMLVVDYSNLYEAKSTETGPQFENILNENVELSAMNKSFLTETAIIYAAWLRKNGKSNLAQSLARKTIAVVGENELLSMFLP